MVLLFVMILWTPGEVVLEASGIFNALTTQTAARRADDVFFILDRFEKAIWAFDGSGERRQVARKGPGPGELDRTNGLSLFDNELYVFSADNIQIFDSEGVYKKRIRLPPGLIVQKTVNGWIGQKQRMGRKQHELSFYNEDFTESRPIISWEEDRPRMRPVKPGQSIDLPVFPELGSFLVSPDGGRLFYRLPGEATIHILDTRDGEQLGTIELPQRYLFDEARGQELVDKLQAKVSSKVNGIFPEFFPYTNGLYWDPSGFFLVAQWQGKELALLRYRPDGSILPNADFTVDQLERIIDAEEDYYFISFKDPVREDMGIRKVPLAHVSAFFSEFPNVE